MVGHVLRQPDPWCDIAGRATGVRPMQRSAGSTQMPSRPLPAENVLLTVCAGVPCSLRLCREGFAGELT
jgi:hypothetical protein